MMPRKKRILITAISIILVSIIIIGTFLFLFLQTELFKTKEELFAKYFAQNFELLNILTPNDGQIEQTLENNKYKSNLIGSIEYTEDINTSNENTSNEINNIQLKIDSQIDKNNQYINSKIELTDKEEKLAGFEYINQNEIYGIKLDGIKQFVSVDMGNISELSGKLNIEIGELKKLLQSTDIREILEFSEEEKQELANRYISIIQSSVTKEKYGKQSNSLITVNNNDIQTNEYYIELSIEEFNNLYIKILQQITSDEILLGKVDKIEELINAKNLVEENEETLRQEIVNKINEKIKKIEDNNIGQEKVKISVYEKNGQTVRTTIEKSKQKISLDVYNNILKIKNTLLGEHEKEQILILEKTQSDLENNINIEYEEIDNNEITTDYQVTFTEKSENNNINKTTEIQISNQKYKAVLNLNNEIEIVEELDNNQNFAENNIELNDLDKTQIDVILNTLKQIKQEQIEKIQSKVSEENYKKILENLGLAKKSNVEISDVPTVTETEKNRYNSQFEFFVSTDLEKNNIKDLLEVTKNNFYDAKFYTKDNRLIDIDIEKINGNDDEAKEYKNNISELVILLKENSTNEEKQKQMLEFLEKNNTKYNVSIQYDKENGLAELVRIQLQDKKQ